MSWIRLESGYHRHSKVYDFAEALGERTAGYYLTVLWGWVAESHEDGDVSSVSDKRLAEMADYRGDAAVFCDALRQCGFLDEDGFIHNWERWQGAFMRKREKDRVAASANRSKIKDLRKVASTVAPTIAPTASPMVAPTVDGTVVRAGRQAGRQALEEQVPELLSSADDAPAQVSLLPEPPPSPAPVDPMEAKIDLVLAHWQRTHGPNIDVSGETQAGLERRRRVRKHLKAKISVEQMIAACDGALRDAYIMGRDPRAPRAYRGVETILRDGTQIEKLAALRGGPIASTGNGGALKSIREERHYSKTIEPVRVEWSAENELARIAAMGRWSKSRTVNVPWDKEWPADLPIPEGYTINRLPKPEPVVRLHDLIGAPLE